MIIYYLNYGIPFTTLVAFSFPFVELLAAGITFVRYGVFRHVNCIPDKKKKIYILIIRGYKRSMNDKGLKISEIFYSFQGESTLMGVPTLFIRLQGCNLKCRICDTKHSWDKKGKIITCKEILKIASKIKTPFVCITGGEPLLQATELQPLIKGLLKLKKTISIETNGAVSINNIPIKIKKIVDVKTPSTGQKASFKKDNIKYLTPYDEVKFVISDKADFEFAENFIHKNKLNKIGCTILMSPNLAKKGLANKLVNWILKSNEKYVFQPQLHKLIKEEPIYLIKRF